MYGKGHIHCALLAAAMSFLPLSAFGGGDAPSPSASSAQAPLANSSIPCRKLSYKRLPDLTVPRMGPIVMGYGNEAVVIGGHTTGYIPTKEAEYLKGDAGTGWRVYIPMTSLSPWWRVTGNLSWEEDAIQTSGSGNHLRWSPTTPPPAPSFPCRS